jgi:hypothetical protein
MEFKLVVTRVFGKYQKGSVIEAESEILQILAGDYAMSVVKVPLSMIHAAVKGG